MKEQSVHSLSLSQINTIKTQKRRSNFYNMMIGAFCIYIFYFIGGLLHESIIKTKFHNWYTNKSQKCSFALGMNLIPHLISWGMAQIYTHFKISKTKGLLGFKIIKTININNEVQIPLKQLFTVGLVTCLSTLFSVMAIQKTSYPVVMMVQSTNVLPVIIVAIFFTRVKDQTQKIGLRQAILSVIISLGMILFQIYNPKFNQKTSNSQLMGVAFLILHLICMGLLPDLQAQIKSKYRPSALKFMSEISRSAAIVTTIFLVFSFELWPFIVYITLHPHFLVNIVLMGLFSSFGQFYVFKLILKFRQHVVPFIISSRKILTVAFSLIYYGHESNYQQWIGVLLVLVAVCIEFGLQIWDVGGIMGLKASSASDSYCENIDTFAPGQLKQINVLSKAQSKQEQINELFDSIRIKKIQSLSFNKKD